MRCGSERKGGVQMLVDREANFLPVRADEGVQLLSRAEKGESGHRLHFELGRELAQVVHVNLQEFTLAF